MKLFTVCGIFVGFLLHVSSDDTFTLADLNPQQGTDKQRSWHEIFKLKDLKGNRKAPEFMMELYDAVAESNGTLKNTNLLDGNVVRSFEGQSSGSYHFFNLTSFRPDERVIKAEFRWPRPTRPYTGHHDFYKVDLHEVLDSTAKPWRGNLISSRLLPVNTKGWEIFNITQMVIKRIRNSGTKDRILVVVASPSDNLLESSIYDGHSDERNAYLVVYSDDRQQNNQNPVFYKGPVRRPVASAVRRRRSGRPFTPTCQRTNLYVDFTKIGWSGWIISPRGYNAYSCAGSCPFPLGEGLRATNHATVRSIMNALKLMPETGKPCCVPDVLQPIS